MDGTVTMGYFIFEVFVQFGVSERVSIWQEDRVPPKVATASGLYDSPGCLADEQLRFLEFWAHIGDNAHRVGSLVFKWNNHFGESLWSNTLQKPLYVWAWQSFVGIETQGSVLDKYCLFALLEGDLHLLAGDLLRLPLQLRHYE